MAFDPLDWDTLGRELGARQDNEAALRAAIGRLYYSMFVKSRDALVAKKLMVSNNSESDHRDVVRQLLNNRRGSASIALGNLRTLRNQADYDTRLPVTFDTYKKAEAFADKVKALCSGDWST